MKKKPENETKTDGCGSLPLAPCSAGLLRAAKKAARAAGRAARANAEWVARFEKEYGHDDISDALVEAVDYSNGNDDLITAEYIAEHSKAGES